MSDTYHKLIELIQDASKEELQKLIEYARALIAQRNQ